jgi:hypothetical protein
VICQEVLRKYDEWCNPRADKIEIVRLSEVEGPKAVESMVGKGYQMRVEYKKK